MPRPKLDNKWTMIKALELGHGLAMHAKATDIESTQRTQFIMTNLGLLVSLSGLHSHSLTSNPSMHPGT